MIISVSRRTDIPAFYSEWFFNRMKEGFVEVRNPMNFNQLRQISLKKEDVDCFVIWSKNPEPMIKRLEELKDYPSIIQYTLNGYGDEIERNLPSMKRRIEIFKELSEKLGPKRLLWRYDPILLSKEYSKEWHYETFEIICQELSTYTEKCTISFLDRYKKIEKRLISAEIWEPSEDDMNELAKGLSEVGRKSEIVLDTCAESLDFSPFGIKPGKCIDDHLINGLFGISVSSEKDKNQREECGCVKSIDIGAYNCCLHHCLYCYANASEATVLKNWEKHDPSLPILIP